MTSLVDIRSFMLAWWSPALLGRVEALIDAKIDARLVTLGLLAAPSITADKPGETGAYRGVPADVVLAAGREAVDHVLDGLRCIFCDIDLASREHGSKWCPLRDVGPEGPPSGDRRS
jgi:hypothetical protein